MTGDGQTRSVRSAGIGWALRLAAVVALVGCAATQYLSRLAPSGQLAQAPLADPATTGSIADTARRTVLDPCTIPPLRR